MLEQIKKVLDLISQINQLKSFGFLTEKEYYKTYHRMLDNIIKYAEEEQIKCEEKINTL